MAKATLRSRTFTVRGAGEFPLDMLRYDRAFPATEADTAAMLDVANRREVRLVMVSEGNPFPTMARWDSFMWDVMGVDD